jgi:hypothetical protein
VSFGNVSSGLSMIAGLDALGPGAARAARTSGREVRATSAAVFAAGLAYLPPAVWVVETPA